MSDPHYIKSQEVRNGMKRHKLVLYRGDDGLYWTAMDDGLGYYRMASDFTLGDAEATFVLRLARLLNTGWETVK